MFLPSDAHWAWRRIVIPLFSLITPVLLAAFVSGLEDLVSALLYVWNSYFNLYTPYDSMAHFINTIINERVCLLVYFEPHKNVYLN